MTVRSDLAEYEWLTGSEAGTLLAELAVDKTPLHTTVERLRGQLTSSQTHLLMEQVELRHRATAKFTQAHRMFFTRLGLEQATDEWVAGYKALRLAGGRLPAAGAAIADLCCGIGGDLMALADQGSAIGVDSNPVAAHFAGVNAGSVIRAIDVAEFDFDGALAWHIDPDRRTAGRRTTSMEFCQPNRETIEGLLKRVPNAAVKLAPGCDVPVEWTERCELEWISRDRECRQLVAWHGDCAADDGKCRATVLASTGGGALRTIVGRPKQPVKITGKLDRYVFDLDPAVLAAKLKGALAAEHQLCALSVGASYLTGPSAIDDFALACFEVDDVVPMRVNKLAQLLRGRGIGQLEIKKRGVDIDPEQLRRELNLRGDNEATLLITPVAGRPTAILGRRVFT